IEVGKPGTELGHRRGTGGLLPEVGERPAAARAGNRFVGADLMAPVLEGTGKAAQEMRIAVVPIRQPRMGEITKHHTKMRRGAAAPGARVPRTGLRSAPP